MKRDSRRAYLSEKQLDRIKAIPVKFTERDRRAWTLGFNAAVQLLGKRIQEAFSMRGLVLRAALDGEPSPTSPPERWPTMPAAEGEP